jgi:three-Cys-motif partner protein
MAVASDLIRKGRVKEVVCVFVENDPDNFRNLNDVVAREAPRHHGVNLLGPFDEDFTTVVDRVINEAGAAIAPSFFFVDPFGFSGVPFQTIKRILALPRSEVFLVLMYRDLNRFLTSPGVEHTLDSLFGTTQWRHLLQSTRSPREREHALRDLYVTQLQQVAGAPYTSTFRVCADEKVETVYYLIHATRHPKGRRLMKDIMYRAGAQGTFAYLGPQDAVARRQMPLFAEQDVPWLKELLVHDLAGETLTYEDIQDRTCMDTLLVDKQYREALHQLEDEGRVEVVRVDSKKRGLKGRDQVSFPVP